MKKINFGTNSVIILLSYVVSPPKDHSRTLFKNKVYEEPLVWNGLVLARAARHFCPQTGSGNLRPRPQTVSELSGMQDIFALRPEVSISGHALRPEVNEVECRPNETYRNNGTYHNTAKY